MNTAHRHLKVLLVEDSEDDATLLELALNRAGFHPRCERVDTAQSFTDALDRQEWDVVIADYVLPGFDGLSALALVKNRSLDLPFIIVSGHITDNTAVAAMKAGAHDYVMKDNLARLAPAVERELRDAEVRNARRQMEKKLWEEHAFRLALENSIPSGITVVNLEGVQTCVNPAFCDMVGWSESELIGAKSPFVYWPEEEREHITTVLTQAINGRIPAKEFELRYRRKSRAEGDRKHFDAAMGFELRYCRKDGDRFDVLVLLTPLRDRFQNISGWLSSVTDITRLKQAESAFRRSHDELEQRVRERTADLSNANAQLKAAMEERCRLELELLEITEMERRRIGLDLHDDLGQKLTGVALMAKGLQLNLAKQGFSEAKQAEQLHKLIEQAMAHARNVAHDLATLGVPENDLPGAIGNLAVHANNSFGIACRFESDEKIPALESNVVRQLYKITQEALTNAIKHGKTKRVSVELSADSNTLLLTIRNSGVPFPSVAGRNTGMGLRIMNYRAHIIGASINIKPGKPDGTVIICELPIAHKR